MTKFAVASVGRDEPILRAYWVPVLEEQNVDLVLRTHDHVHARGYNNVSNSGAKHEK